MAQDPLLITEEDALLLGEDDLGLGSLSNLSVEELSEIEVDDFAGEGPNIFDSAAEFGGNIIDESFRSLSSTLSTSGRAEDSALSPLQTELGQPENGVASVASQAFGQTLTGGGLIAAGGLVAGPIGAGIAGGAFLIQQIRSEMRNVEDEVLRRTGDAELASGAGSRAGLVIAATEALGFAGGPLGRLMSKYVPTKFATKMLSGSGKAVSVGPKVAMDAADELTANLLVGGNARKALGQAGLGFVAEGSTEVVQEASQAAIVETAVDPSLSFSDEAGKFLKSRQALDVFLGSGLAGGSRGGLDLLLNESKTPADEAAVELMEDVTQLRDPESSVTSVEVSNELLTRDILEQAIPEGSAAAKDVVIVDDGDGRLVLESQIEKPPEVKETPDASQSNERIARESEGDNQQEAKKTQEGETESSTAQPTQEQEGRTEQVAERTPPEELRTSEIESGTSRTASGREFGFTREVLPLSEITVQEQLPNFKRDADPETGVVGDPADFPTEFDPVQAGDIVVLERRDGQREVLSGRNRFAIAQRDPSVEQISTKVIRESDDFTVDDALALDAELNIRDNQGSTEDFTEFFRRTQIPEQTARERGLLRNTRGRQGFFIGTAGSPGLVAAFQAGRVNAKSAAAIAEEAPQNEALQRVGLQQASKGRSTEMAVNTMRVAEQTNVGGGAVQGDLFGGNDQALQDAETLGRAATALQRQAQDDLRTLRQIQRLGSSERGITSRFPEIVSRFDISSPENLQSEISRLADEVSDWRSWPVHPELVFRVQAEARTVRPELELDLTNPEPLTRPQSQPQEILSQEVPVEPRAEELESESAIQNELVPVPNIETAESQTEAFATYDTNVQKQNGRPVSREQKTSVAPVSKERKLTSAMGAESIRAFKETTESIRTRTTDARPAEVKALWGDEPGDTYIPIKIADTKEQINQKIDQNGLVPSAQDAISGSFSPELNAGERILFIGEVRKRVDDKIRFARNPEQTEITPEMRDTYINLGVDLGHLMSDLSNESGQVQRMLQEYARSPREVIIRGLDRQRRKFFKDRGIAYRDLDPEILAQINELADKIEALGDDSVFARELHRQMLTILARADGVSPADVITAYWYANILSGFNTQAINLFGNGINLFLRTLGTSVVTNPVDTIQSLIGMARGQKKAGRDAIAALKGDDISRTLAKVQVPSALEFIDGPLGWGKWVFRALGAGDAYFYRTAKEGRAYLAASKLAREQAASDDVSFAEAMASLVHNSEVEMREAMAQAQQEAQIFGEATENDIKRRAYEILTQRRPEQIRDESQRFGSYATFTNPPDGLMGHVARAVNNFVDKASVDTRWGNFKVAKVVVPFVNIVANVASSSLDFTPVGVARFANNGKLFDKQGYKTQQERNDALGNAIVGMTLTTLIMAIAEGEAGEDDPAFAIYGVGPDNPQKRKQLQNQGWKPFSIKINDTYIRYHETPLAIVFAALGGWYDSLRYKDIRTTPDRLGFAMTRASGAFLESGFLTGVADVLDMMRGRKKPGPLATGFGRGFIPAQGLLRDIAKITDPELVNAKDSAYAAIIKDVPFAQGFGTRPTLNAFGEPVTLDWLSRTPLVSRMLSTRVDDPDWTWLAEGGFTLPGLQEKITIPMGRGRRQKRALQAIKDGRVETMGRVYFDTFTPEEHYEYVKRQGAKVREIISTLRNSNLAGEDLQKELNRRVKKARQDTKLELLGIRPSRRRRKRRTRGG